VDRALSCDRLQRGNASSTPCIQIQGYENAVFFRGVQEETFGMAAGGWKVIANLTLVISAGLVPPVCGCAKGDEPTAAAAAVEPAAQAIKPAPATPIDAKKIELGGSTWDPAWDAIVEQALPPEMLSMQVPHDVHRFCPRFYQMSDVDKRAFWAYFFQALAGAEAGLNPKTRVRHTEPEVAVTDGVSGRLVRSEGLLQLTYEDQKRYGCDFDWEADRALKPNDPARTILQPKNNLQCGVKILTKQIIDQHKPLFARAAYWSTLQPGTISYRVFAKQMTNPPLACGLHMKTAMAKKPVARQDASAAQ
jgi:hypothetical protein